jgi:LmbE family N-acetylglucosaminyl deacetylase
MSEFHPTRAAAEVFAPDGCPTNAALARTTHLCIAAHADDIEWIGYHGIAACFGRTDARFCGVIVTDGAGSPRGGPYAGTSDEAMVAVRRVEQRRAAVVGDYGALVQLAHRSAAVKDPRDRAVEDELVALLRATRPRFVYMHAPTDRHATHVAVAARAVAALRRVDAESNGGERPERVLGVEGWGDLDWLADEDRVELDVGARPHLASALIGVFDSQIEGGKRYDLAVAARRVAHATFASPRALDGATGLALAVDLSPVCRAGGPALAEFVDGLLARFAAATRARLGAHVPHG